MNNPIKVAPIDFGEIKTNILDYFKKQDKYKDWDFDSPGSTLNLLCEILAYNTATNAIIANRSASEKFLDSAQSRASVVSRAKEMGYVPKSMRCSQMIVDVVVQTSSGLDFMILPSGTKFTVSGVSTGSVSFITDRSYIGYPDANNIVTFYDVKLFYGTFTTLALNVSSEVRAYTIPDSTIDTDTLSVLVNGSTAKRLYTDIELYDVDANTLIYQIQENQFGTYDLIFGDGVFGVRVTSSDTVVVQYIKAESDLAAEGISKIELATAFNNVIAADVVVRTSSSGFKPKESLESVRINAPLALKANNRCVTLADYKHLITTKYPFVKSAVVWTVDLEEADTYDYGSVYFSALNELNEPLDSGQALIISQDIEENFGVAGVSLIHVPMEVIFVSPIIKLVVDEWLVDISQADLNTRIIEVVRSVANSSSGITKEFSAYTITSAITAAIPGIVFAQVDLRVMKNVQLYTSQIANTQFSFGVELTHPFDGYGEAVDGVLRSTDFRTSVQAKQMFFNDDGSGNIRLFYNTTSGEKRYVNNNIGSVDYETGSVSITGITPFFEEVISVTGVPASNNLTVTKNNMLVLDPTKSVIEIEFKKTRLR